MRTLTISAVAALAVLGAATLPASAKKDKPAAYIGTWATSLAGCKAAAGSKDAPVVLAENEYSQFESHCTFDKLVWRSYAWHTKAACTVSGDKQDEKLEIAVSGDALMLHWGAANSTVNYIRCK